MTTLFDVAKEVYGDMYIYRSIPNINSDAEMLTISSKKGSVDVFLSGLERSKSKDINGLIRDKIKQSIFILDSN
jgi:hypothetical protein